MLTSVKCCSDLFRLYYTLSLAQPSPPDFQIAVHVAPANNFLPIFMLLAPLPSLVPVWCQRDTSFPIAWLSGLQEPHIWIHPGTIRLLCRKMKVSQTSKMVQPPRALTAKPNDPSLIPGSHIEGGTDPNNLSSAFLFCFDCLFFLRQGFTV